MVALGTVLPAGMHGIALRGSRRPATARCDRQCTTCALRISAQRAPCARGRRVWGVRRRRLLGSLVGAIHTRATRVQTQPSEPCKASTTLSHLNPSSLPSYIGSGSGSAAASASAAPNGSMSSPWTRKGFRDTDAGGPRAQSASLAPSLGYPRCNSVELARHGPYGMPHAGPSPPPFSRSPWLPASVPLSLTTAVRCTRFTTRSAITL
jgi:hypothetical protein